MILALHRLLGALTTSSTNTTRPAQGVLRRCHRGRGPQAHISIDLVDIDPPDLVHGVLQIILAILFVLGGHFVLALLVRRGGCCCCSCSATAAGCCAHGVWQGEGLTPSQQGPNGAEVAGGLDAAGGLC